MAIAAKEYGFAEAYVPAANSHEAALVSGIAVYPVNSLRELLQHMLGFVTLQQVNPGTAFRKPKQATVDFAFIASQQLAKRA